MNVSEILEIQLSTVVIWQKICYLCIIESASLISEMSVNIYEIQLSQNPPLLDENAGLEINERMFILRLQEFHKTFNI